MLSVRPDNDDVSAIFNHFKYLYLCKLTTIYQIVIDWVSLFNGISTFVCYLMPKPSFKKNSSDAGRIRGFIPFPRIFVQKWT